MNYEKKKVEVIIIVIYIKSSRSCDRKEIILIKKILCIQYFFLNLRIIHE